MVQLRECWAYLDGLELQVKAGSAGGRRPRSHSCCRPSWNQQRDKSIWVRSQDISKWLGIFVLQETLQMRKMKTGLRKSNIHV